MLSYTLYFLLVVGLAVLLTSALRRFNEDIGKRPSPEEDQAFSDRMKKIESDFDKLIRSSDEKPS